MRDLSCGDARVLLELEVRRVQCRSCGKVKRERLDFLADNPFYTRRFAHYVGRHLRVRLVVSCRTAGKGKSVSGYPAPAGWRRCR